MIEAYKKFWKGYVDFKGRSTRTDYWFLVLAQWLAYLFFGFLLVLIMILGGDSSAYTSDLSSWQMISIFVVLFALGAYMLASILPTIAIIVRRLRDVGYHWALIFLSLIPYLGAFVIFILTLRKTKVEVSSQNFDTPRH
ncbi:DUF805 domain-containing protein [uncultured Streptococcus sp.]|uniref:DUF805 domain-containing protein n=1 Tax=uncultured Streptococcus sp. TaxID=83427 RepID=UPI0028DC7434|nr:DUF805 domain-containing protein [uncultured Streptococcus sp.]